MRHRLVERAAEIMKEARTATVAAIDGSGYPRASTISSIKTEGASRAWFATGLNSGKVRCYRQNPRASLCYRDEGNNVTLIGEMEVLSDPECKRGLWMDWFIEHFPEGPEDPNYCILRFTARRGAFWIDGQYREFDERELVSPAGSQGASVLSHPPEIGGGAPSHKGALTVHRE